MLKTISHNVFEINYSNTYNMTNKNEILYQYKNGNIQVTFFTDGTKTMEYEEKPFPYFPESVNIKIADYCNVKHEFIYADLNKLRAILISLPAGVELNIEGDAALKHPDLIEFLVWCQSRGLICNLIVKHVFLKEYRAIIETLVEENLVIDIIVPINENSVCINNLTNLKTPQYDCIKDNSIFSMYIDAVNQEYAPTSVSSDRKFFKDLSLYEYFINYKNLE